MNAEVYLYDQTRDLTDFCEHPQVVNFWDKMIENVRRIDNSGKKRKLSKADQARCYKEFGKYLNELFADSEPGELTKISLAQMAKKLGDNYWASPVITFKVNLFQFTRITTEGEVYFYEMKFIIIANPAQINFELRN